MCRRRMRRRLAAWRQRTLDVFAQSVEPEVHSQPQRSDPVQNEAKPRSRGIHVAWRGVAAVAGDGGGSYGRLQFIQRRTRSVAAPFSKVLENLRGAKSLELRVTKDGQAAQVWVRAPGLVRLEDSPQQYRIAPGSRLWKIDEAANTGRPAIRRGSSMPDQQVDLLGLLEVGVTDATPLLNAEPTEQIEYASRKCFVYRAELPGNDGRAADRSVCRRANRATGGHHRQSVDRPARVGPPLAELQLVAMNAAGGRSEVRRRQVADGRRPHRQDRRRAGHRRAAADAGPALDADLPRDAAQAGRLAADRSARRQRRQGRGCRRTSN